MGDKENTTLVLRNALLRLGAREYEVVALTMIPDRGLAALNYATSKGAEHPIAYAIKLFDSDDWNPAGEVARKGTNQHAEPSAPLPSPRPEENLEEARKLMATLWGSR